MTVALDPARRERFSRVLDDVLRRSQAQSYAGHNKHDGLNSPLLAALLGWSRWPRIVAIQAVMRAPINLRPWLGVQPTRNAKGQGLFAHAWLDRYEAEGEEGFLREGLRLLDWLLEHPSVGFRGLSWGYPYPWQDVGFFAPRLFPNRVVTCWIGFAMVRAAVLTEDERFATAVGEIAEFLLGEPRVLHDSSEMLCLSYVPDPEVAMAVVDVPALCGAFLAEAAALLERPDLLHDARRLLAWVADKQAAYGAFYYTHPPGDSLITHDNYHTAIVLDCFDRYREATGETLFVDCYERGLLFYRDHLFTGDGAPRWMHDGKRATDKPFDIHGSASAVLCFTRAARRSREYLASALRTLEWTLDHLYDERGFFYYQVSRWGTKRFSLQRWCNGWMSWALASILRLDRELDER